jgi:hypothetical protein
MDSELRAELTQLQGEWLEHLRRWERSGVTLKAYAQREGLNHRRLSRFKRILSDKGVYREGEALSQRFVRAQIELEHEAVSLCRVRLRNGCVVELGGEVRGVFLRELLHTVGTLP